MVKTVILILSFIFVLVPIAQAEQTKTPEFSVSFHIADHTESQLGAKYEKKYSTDEIGTSTILVSNAMIILLRDDDGDEYYPKLTCRLDLDADKTTNYYVIFYLNFYGDWFTYDDIKTAVYTLEEGYSPEEGILDLDLYFISGYTPMKVQIKVEVYSENGDLLATYGPDDDPDLKDIQAEAADHDVKEDPFLATPTPTPTLCEATIISADPELLGLAKKNSGEVTVTVTGADGCAVEGEMVTATTNMAGNKRISISPSSGETDENGQAIFTITAKKTGNARVTFSAGDLRESILVKVTK